MFKKHPQFTFAFAIIFLAELFAVINNFTEMRYFTKPLITVSLMVFLYITVKLKSKFTDKIKIGLAFSLLGDIFLLFTQQNENLFLFGLVAFLIAHLFYLRAFYLDSIKKVEVQKRYITPIFMVFGFFCVAFYYNIQPYLGGQSIPVLIYTFVITIMAIMAALRYGKVKMSSFRLVLFGAIFFLLSDSLLAYNKFVDRMQIGNLLVMITYMLAQFLITMGTVERKYKGVN